MVAGYYADDRWAFIEKIQDWYQQKSQFWFILSILSFSSIFVFDILLNFASQANPIPYPVWKNNRDMKSAEGSNAIRLVPLAALLTFAEQNLIARYKYVTVIIGGRKFFVTPYEWVPENSVVVKDDKSGSIFGIL